MRKIHALFLASVLLATFTMSLSAATEQAPLKLNFGVYTTEKPTTMVNKLRPILNEIETRLSQRLERPVQIALQVSLDYEESIADLVKGKVDFARLEQSAYIQAKARQPGIKILAVEGDNRRSAFIGHFVVRDDSPLRTLEDLHGRSVAFAQPVSASDRYIPQLYLADQGITQKDLAEVVYLDRQDKVAAAVAMGKVEAGAISESTLRDQFARGASLRVISDYTNPTRPWVARADMPHDQSLQLREVLISMRGVKVLELIKKDCFIPGTDSNFSLVKQAIEENWRFNGNQVPSIRDEVERRAQ